MKFEIDTSDLVNLAKWFRFSPKEFRRAESMMMNNFAFGARQKAILLTKKRMVIRNPRFVESRFQVKKASAALPVAILGTATARRFTGWTEQEYGTKTARKRVASTFARGGSKRGKIASKYRLKPARHVKTKKEFGIRSDKRFMAAILDRQERGMFRVGGQVMTRQGRKLHIVQTMAKPSKLQPKRRPFMRTAANMYMSSISLSAEFYKVAHRVVHPPKRSRLKFR